MKTIVSPQSLPGIPWENKPENCNESMWRYSGNPVIGWSYLT